MCKPEDAKVGSPRMSLWNKNACMLQGVVWFHKKNTTVFFRTFQTFLIFQSSSYSVSKT